MWKRHELRAGGLRRGDHRELSAIAVVPVKQRIGATRLPITEVPVLVDNPGATVRSTLWGGMACTYSQLRAGTDLTPLLQGLPDDLCPCPHWGYVLKGAIQVRYTDGRQEVLGAGEVFYLPPGHTASCEVDSEFVEFSPEGPYNEVGEHVLRMLQG